MSELFWIYAIISVMVLALVMVIRNGMTSWAWNFMLIMVILFAGLFKITGTPRDAVFFSTIERMHGDVEVLYHGVIPRKAIYLLIRHDPSERPYLIEIAWTKELEQQIAAAQMKATEQQTGLMVDVDMLSRWRIPPPPPRKEHGGTRSQTDNGDPHGRRVPGDGKEGGETMFHPMPVTGDPDKNPSRSITIDRETTQGGHNE